MSEAPFRDREHMLNCLLDAEIQAYRRPGMTVRDLAPLLSTDELRTLYYQRKIRELAELQGMDPDAE